MTSFELDESTVPRQGDVYLWLLEMLRFVGFDDCQASFFLMSLKDPHLEWQLGVEMIHACVATGLVKLIPSGGEDGCPTDEEVLQQLSRQCPEERESPGTAVANAWIGTYLFGTETCRVLLARHGFLDRMRALVLAEVVAQGVASEEVQSSDAKSVAECSQAGVDRLRLLAEQSAQLERATALELRQKAFVAELDSLFKSHEVLQYRTRQ